MRLWRWKGLVRKELCHQYIGVSLRKHQLANLLQGSGVFHRGQVSRIATLADRLHRPPQQLAAARLGQRRHEKHTCRPRHRPQVAVHQLHDLTLEPQPRGGIRQVLVRADELAAHGLVVRVCQLALDAGYEVVQATTPPGSGGGATP